MTSLSSWSHMLSCKTLYVLAAMREKKVMEAREGIKRLLKQIDAARLVKFDGDFKLALELARACRKLAACSLQKSREMVE